MLPGKERLWRVVERSMFHACRRSWRLYNALSVVVDDRGVRLPVGNGIGLNMIGEDADISPVISWVYARRGGLFVDVGANVGRTLVALLRHDRQIPYIGFEPALQAARNVSLIIKENGLSATHSILPIGLSQQTGYATLYANSDHDVSATTNCATRPAAGYRIKTLIALGVGDDYVLGHPEVAMLKIDAEGAEVSVLQGFSKTLLQHKPVVCIEILPIQELERGTYSREVFGELSDTHRHRLIDERRKHAAAIRDLLHSFDYRICKIRDGHLASDADVMSSNYEDYDFVAVHHSST